MHQPITVVVSKGQSNHPDRRKLEEQIATRLAAAPEFDVVLTANLYDLVPNGPALTKLRATDGPLVVLSWLYSRATRWILDRHGVHGQEGHIELAMDSEEDEDDIPSPDDDNAADRVISNRQLPSRRIYCLDLRAAESEQPFVEEVKRIAAEESDSTDTAVAGSENGNLRSPQHVETESGRRWYPVIDFSRCTNCMECIDFCLFGVYGIDNAETILVEQPDNCRKGCPACSRVCPEHAIIFPQHKSPAIAGSPAEVGGFKIDLSRLFGAPDQKEDALAAAVRERDEQLVAVGRDAVGQQVGIPKRQENKQERPKDKLDSLVEELDELDL
jgi:Pyruvate/2-oxoacid:ferredoxin oxidoreductase delta subunit